jgi:hypothetical protein
VVFPGYSGFLHQKKKRPIKAIAEILLKVALNIITSIPKNIKSAEITMQL